MVWYQKSMGNKYGAKKTVYNNLKYDSKMEATYAQDLDLRLYSGELKDIQRQVRISLDVNGYHICNYIVDFVLTYADDSVELVEVKGFATEVYRLKRKLLEATYLKDNPGVRYLVVTR